MTQVRTEPLGNAHLLAIVLAQFAGTSLWFAGNAILPNLQPLLGTTALSGWITSAVQLGFIAGTLVYTLYRIPDTYPATRVFLVSVIAAAIFNLLILVLPLQSGWVLLSRFGTGFFLAGVYPVGMKIAADWFRPVLGRAMGFLVGALVLGTSLPHLIRGVGQSLPYESVLLTVSVLAVAGGLLLVWVMPATPVPRRPGTFSLSVFPMLFRPGPLRAGVTGYFGHMWELYALWAFLPALLTIYSQQHPNFLFNKSVWAFLGIAAGFIGCAAGGLIALRFGSQRVATVNLMISGCCTALIPLMVEAPPAFFLAFLIVYGITIAGDSPQLTTIISTNVPDHVRGSLLTLATCIGFSITIVSIQTLAWLLPYSGNSIWAFWLLVPGPILGLWGLLNKPATQ
ncbi:MFS transporter [Fibrella forsythiae]|uniref:MFS transporter n=1 Tax=Fibrella forsythiae TaxID=2817061 RepID=A0ABS3JK85_9BACT|nr:MFS transporter [Fibrella forsythiae]MBO0950419.1 MFS transporter [Fibrella forsythiae]